MTTALKQKFGGVSGMPISVSKEADQQANAGRESTVHERAYSEQSQEDPNNEQQQKHSRRGDAAGTTATELERDLGS
jgi:hypothetical protein